MPKSEDVTWTAVGRGAFKEIYKSNDKVRLLDNSSYSGPWAKQIRIANEHSYLTEPSRQVRLIKEVNSDWQDKVGISNDEVLMPFFEGNSPSDSERAEKVLTTFIETGRVLLDAVVEDNMLKNAKGEIRIVDIDLLIRPESPTSYKYLFFKQQPDHIQWGKTIWEHRLLNRFEYECTSMNTIRLIKRLARLIQTYEPSDIPERFLTLQVINLIEHSKNEPLSKKEIHDLEYQFKIGDFCSIL